MKKNQPLRIQLISLITLAFIFAIDLLVPLGVSIGVLYVFCFLLIIGQTKKTILTFAIIITILIILKLVIYYTADITLIIFANRILSIFVIVISAFLALRNRNLYEKTERERKYRLRLLEEKNEELESMDDAINTYLLFSISNTKGEIIYVNSKFCEISKYTKEELIGENHRILNSNFHSKEFFNELWKSVATGKVWNAEVKNKAKDGTFFWVDTTAFPIHDKNGKTIKYFCLRMPIDDKKKYELSREEYTKGLEEMMFITSHKVRQPITQILGISNMLCSSRLSQKELNEIVGYMGQSVLSLDTFTKELTKFIYDQQSKVEMKTDYNAQ